MLSDRSLRNASLIIPSQLLPTSFRLQISGRIVGRGGLCKPTPNDSGTQGAGVGKGGEQVLSGSVGSILESSSRSSQVGAGVAAGELGYRWQQVEGVRAPGQRESPVRWRGSEDLPAPPQLRLLEQ